MDQALPPGKLIAADDTALRPLMPFTVQNRGKDEVSIDLL
jgi:hypothetical protein